MGRGRPWLLAAALVALAVFCYVHDSEKGGFLNCPFRYITGWLCPGCGSQRALHDLLHGRVAEAFGHNALLVLSVPLLIGQWAVGRFVLSGRALSANNLVVYGWLVLVLGWWLGRNLWA